jgi:hypothetical protein
MLSQDTSPHPDRPREQRPQQHLPPPARPGTRTAPSSRRESPNPAAIAAPPLHPEPRHLAAGDPDHPPERAGLAADPPPAGQHHSNQHHDSDHDQRRARQAARSPCTPVSSPPRNAASPGPGEAERQPRGACNGRDRQIRARNQPALGHRNHARRRAIRCEASCSVSGHVARCQVAIQDRLVLVLGHILTSAALRAGLPRPGPPNAPVMSDPGRSEAEPGHVAITVAAMTGPAPKMPVRLVPDALSAMASFFLDSRIWASRRRMSSKSSAASPPGGAGWLG